MWHRWPGPEATPKTGRAATQWKSECLPQAFWFEVGLAELDHDSNEIHW
jgi:hypothetical protein